jgi:predicted GH43/DUF377 family glycosyl hydrolase
MRIVLVCVAASTLIGCSRYRDFTLPAQPGGPSSVTVEWHANPVPVLGPSASWDAVDVLNPSVIRSAGGYQNFYSGYDGKLWHTGVAISPDGLNWTKQTLLISPKPDGYIAANGSAIRFQGETLYYYQSGRHPQIRLGPKARQVVLSPGPWDSWDEQGVADPYVIEVQGKLYMYYLGMDRARRQRLGVAVSRDGLIWYKLRSNPILEPGGYGAFDENGLGEPAVWVSNGSYWMLFTGRAQDEQRRLGLARSTDGVHWQRMQTVFEGDQPWNKQVICDPTVLVEGETVRVWFGGGNVAAPDENIHGRIGYAVLKIRP